MTAAPKPWDGIPDSPDREGWHWMNGYLSWWDGADWWNRTKSSSIGASQARHYIYGGPIPSPAELAQMHAELAALRRVADAALALRKAENDSNETDFASDLWCKQISDEFDQASREFDAALDALPDQQVQP